MPITVNGPEGLLAASGGDLGHSSWTEVTQEDVNAFADATGDRQWIHVDPERAKDGPFGGPIAHGYLTLSLLIPMVSEVLVIEGISASVNYGLNKVRFPAPVRVGSRVRLVATLKEAVPVSGGVQILVDGVIEIEGSDRPACVAQAVYRHLA